MTDFEKQVLADLAELKANMHWLIGNGRAGVIRELTERVDRHERLVQRVSAIGALLAGLLTLLHVGVDYLKLH